MKRILPLVFLLVLLCGCKNGDSSAATIPTESATEPLPGTHISDSGIEQQTDGAVRSYQTNGQIAWIAPFGDRLLVAYAGENTTLTVLSGAEGTVDATTQLPEKLEKNDSWQVTATGFAYYQKTDRKVIYLDEALVPIRAVQLPETVTADPVVTADGKRIFYCEGQSIYVMNAEQKISRLLRTNTCLQQNLDGCCWDGTILRVNTQDEKQRWYYLYISAESGETLHTEHHVKELYTTDSRYFAACTEGSMIQYLFGGEGEKQRLLIPGQLFCCIESDGAVGVTTTEQKHTVISFYRLENCSRIAAVTVPMQLTVKDCAENLGENSVWLLTEDGKLLRWDIGKSAVTDATVYTGMIYTADTPDRAGLAACEERANTLGDAHGVEIRIWEQALPGHEDASPEYQTESINTALDALETEFAKFPEYFLSESVNGTLCICIVREIDGVTDSTYRYLAGNMYILISSGEDVGRAFLEQFAYVADVHILSNSPMVDDWASMNPEGFTYGNNTVDEAYLSGETRAFANAEATVTVTADRASIFYYAIQPGNEAMFQAPIMQQKLLTYCKAIRDAWGLKKSPETFLWEQYLTESIAYK